MLVLDMLAGTLLVWATIAWICPNPADGTFKRVGLARPAIAFRLVAGSPAGIDAALEFDRMTAG
jgi:hypothetical protein